MCDTLKLFVIFIYCIINCWIVHSTDRYILITMDTSEDCWLETPCMWRVPVCLIRSIARPMVRSTCETYIVNHFVNSIVKYRIYIKVLILNPSGEFHLIHHNLEAER